MLRTKISRFFLLIFLVLSCASVPIVTHAQVSNQLQAGVKAASGGSDKCDNGTDSHGHAQTSTNAQTCLNNTIAKIVNIISSLVGVIAVIMIIVAGFRYVASAGNAETAKGARNTILYAIIGLVIVALAQIIVRFVLNNV